MSIPQDQQTKMDTCQERCKSESPGTHLPPVLRHSDHYPVPTESPNLCRKKKDIVLQSPSFQH